MIIALAHISLSNSLGWKDKVTRDDKAKVLLSMPIAFLLWLLVVLLLRFINIDVFKAHELVFIAIGLVAWVASSIFITAKTSYAKTINAGKVYVRLSNLSKFLLSSAVVLTVFLSIPAFVFGLFWHYVF